MGGKVRIVFDEDGYPRELSSTADCERAIREGALTRDMDVTVYRDEQQPSVVKARNVGELKPLFGVGQKPDARVRPEQGPPPPPPPPPPPHKPVPAPTASPVPAKPEKIAAPPRTPPPAAGTAASAPILTVKPEEPASAPQGAAAQAEPPRVRDDPTIGEMLQKLLDHIRENRPPPNGNHGGIIALVIVVLVGGFAVSQCTKGPRAPEGAGNASTNMAVDIPVPARATPAPATKAGHDASANSGRGTRQTPPKPERARRERPPPPVEEEGSEPDQVICILPSTKEARMSRAACTSNAGVVY